MQLKIENRQQLLTVLAIGVVSLLAADRLVLSPLTRGWRARSERITALNDLIARGTALMERSESMGVRWRDMQAHDLETEVSSAENEVVKSAARWARESRLTFTSIIPQWKNHDTGYWTLECRASGFGDMQSVTRFLYALEKDPLGVRLEECTLSSRDDDGRLLTLAIQFSALRLPEPKEGS